MTEDEESELVVMTVVEGGRVCVKLKLLENTECELENPGRELEALVVEDRERLEEVGRWGEVGVEVRELGSGVGGDEDVDDGIGEESSLKKADRGAVEVTELLSGGGMPAGNTTVLMSGIPAAASGERQPVSFDASTENGPAINAPPALSDRRKSTLDPAVTFASQKKLVSCIPLYSVSISRPPGSLMEILSTYGGEPLCQLTTVV